MTDHYEPNRFLGFPVRTGPRAKRGEESQRVMGFPVDLANWFGGGDSGGDSSGGGRDQPGPLAQPVRGYKRWLRRRRLGPYAVDEDDSRSRR
jgi:hypothetical protein